MSEAIQVEIDQEIEDLVPTYLSNLQNNIEKIRNGVAASDFEAVRVLGHNMKGSGSGYGFHEVSRVGAEIEKAAKASEGAEISTLIDGLAKYMTEIKIVYV